MVYELHLSKTVTKKLSQAKELGRGNGIGTLRNMELRRVSADLRKLQRESGAHIRAEGG